MPAWPRKAVLQARLGLAAERFAAVWMPLALTAAAIAVLGIWGVFQATPVGARSALVVGLLAVAAGLAIVNLVRLRWPSRSEAMERLGVDYAGERDSLAVGDPVLWALHQQRLDAALASARPVRLGDGVAAADPMALRYALAMAAALGLWTVGTPASEARVAEAFRPIGEMGSETQVLLASFGARAGGGLQFAALSLESVSRMAEGRAPARLRLERASLQSRAQTPGKPRIRPAASSPYPTR